MSTAAREPEPRANSIAATIRERGQRVTPQRMAVIEEFLTRRDHPSVEQIYRSVSERFSMMAVSTVYDTLRLLVELGEAVEVSAGGSETRYDPLTGDHCHLICTQCKQVIDLDMPGDAEAKLSPAAVERVGFAAERVILQAYGLCAQCRSTASTRTS